MDKFAIRELEPERSFSARLGTTVRQKLPNLRSMQINVSVGFSAKQAQVNRQRQETIARRHTTVLLAQE